VKLGFLFLLFGGITIRYQHERCSPSSGIEAGIEAKAWKIDRKCP